MHYSSQEPLIVHAGMPKTLQTDTLHCAMHSDSVAFLLTGQSTVTVFRVKIFCTKTWCTCFKQATAGAHFCTKTWCTCFKQATAGAHKSVHKAMPRGPPQQLWGWVHQPPSSTAQQAQVLVQAYARVYRCGAHLYL